MQIAPVLAGVAQAANKDPDRIIHPVELLEEVARRALDDAAVAPAEIGAVFATPLSVYSDDNAGAMVAERLGIPAGRRGESTYSGAGPQRLLMQAIEALDAGAGAVLIVGGIADQSVRQARRRGLEPPAPPTSVWSQGSDGVQDSRLRMPSWMGQSAELTSGGAMPVSYFALVESSLRAGEHCDRQRLALGDLLAPFTRAAARRPDVAWFPTPRSAAEIATPSESNRFIAEPYTKLMCSFPTVDLAAAVVVTTRDRTGRGVRPHALAAAKEPNPPSMRPVYHRSLALERTVATALDLAGIEGRDLALFDLYSCFPAAVQMAAAAFGLAPDDPRPRTVTGGLPYFGGPGASYSLHGLVCMVEELRARPGALGAVFGLGGMINDFAAGIYGTGEHAFAMHDLGPLTDTVVELAPAAEGPAIVEAMTVLHERSDGPTAAPIIARLADGRRIGARAADADTPRELSGKSLVGREVTLTTHDGKVRYAI